ncbi:hypothetical protein HMPREF1869_01327 [Bacteroidales bacterium KA00251]|nr:hypothetical protein HMPREF1869_01327 [Bacteroidales bacterium KA00251]
MEVTLRCSARRDFPTVRRWRRPCVERFPSFLYQEKCNVLFAKKKKLS